MQISWVHNLRPGVQISETGSEAQLHRMVASFRDMFLFTLFWPLIVPWKFLMVTEAFSARLVGLFSGLAQGGLVASLTIAHMLLSRGGARKLLFGGGFTLPRRESVAAPGTPPSLAEATAPECGFLLGDLTEQPPHVAPPAGPVTPDKLPAEFIPLDSPLLMEEGMLEESPGSLQESYELEEHPCEEVPEGMLLSEVVPGQKAGASSLPAAVSPQHNQQVPNLQHLRSRLRDAQMRMEERGQQSVGVVREQYVQQRFASLRRLREKEAELLGEVGRPQSGGGIEAEAGEQGAHAPGSAAPKGPTLTRLNSFPVALSEDGSSDEEALAQHSAHSREAHGPSRLRRGGR